MRKLVFMSHRYFRHVFKGNIKDVSLIDHRVVDNVVVRANVKIASVNPDCVSVYGGKRDIAAINDCLQFWDCKIKLVPWWKMLSRPKIDLKLDDRVIVVKFNKTTGECGFVLYHRKLPNENLQLYDYLGENRGTVKWFHSKNWLGQDAGPPLTDEEYYARKRQLKGLL